MHHPKVYMCRAGATGTAMAVPVFEGKKKENEERKKKRCGVEPKD